MFTKKKKSRIQISAPSNFEHRVHTDFDEQEQKFVGLPRQWQSLIEDTAKRPKPFIDVTVITTVEPRKVRGHGGGGGAGLCFQLESWPLNTKRSKCTHFTVVFVEQDSLTLGKCFIRAGPKYWNHQVSFVFGLIGVLGYSKNPEYRTIRDADQS